VDLVRAQGNQLIEPPEQNGWNKPAHAAAVDAEDAYRLLGNRHL
jgi:hypothetical protein